MKFFSFLNKKPKLDRLYVQGDKDALLQLRKRFSAFCSGDEISVELMSSILDTAEELQNLRSQKNLLESEVLRLQNKNKALKKQII